MHLIIIYFKNILLRLCFLSLTALPMASPPPLLTAAAETKATTGRSWTENVKPSVLIMILILSITVIVSVSICLLLRHLKNRRRLRQLSPLPTSSPAIHRVNPEPSPPSTGSNKDSIVSGDCAVCLSKFEPSDKPKLLPLCGHAFHAHCIDTWFASNKTCPLCRSPLFASESSDLIKVLHGAVGSNGSGSFRLQLGSIGGGQQPGSESRERRSYSVGSFDYIVEDESEVTGNQSHRRNVCDKEEFEGAEAPGLSAEVPTGSGRSRVKDYVDRLSFSLSSRAGSFRSSGRFFTGSSRRSDISGGADYDVEANRVGEEISEMFRWFSGV